MNTVTTNDPGLGEGSGNDDPHSLHITEVLISHFPENRYEYRGVVWSLDETGRVLVEQTLQGRRKPEWLVNMRHQSRGQLVVTIQARGNDTLPWQSVGKLNIDPLRSLNGSRSAVLELPLPGWAEAPGLQLSVRLLKTPANTGTSPVGQLGEGGRLQRPAAAAAPPSASVDDPLATPLTPAEQVIVKDIWNKLLAYQDMLIDMFFERLLHEEPDLIDAFGEAIDLVPRYFAELFDGSVRRINPHTERILRESYRGAYPDPLEGRQPFDTLAQLLVDLGMRPTHWQTARRVWSWMLTQVPHLEEYDRENLAKGVHSAAYRFFTLHILPAVEVATRRYDASLSADMIRQMRRTSDCLAADALGNGVEFYRLLFESHPQIMAYFGRTDIDSLSRHLMQTIAFLLKSLEAGQDVAFELRELSRIHTSHRIPPDAYASIAAPLITVMQQCVPDFTDEEATAWITLLNRVSAVLRQPMLNQQRLIDEATEFIRQVGDELAWEPANTEQRLQAIEREIRTTGTYIQTYEELAYGAQLAWRNASKCIGRIAWRNMIVRDLRHVNDPDTMFQECVEHARMATNGGNVQIVMNVFRPRKPGERWGPRIWNSQYIRYAAYEQPDGTILGDKANLKLTQAIMRQGWTPPADRTAFDCLPLVIDVPGHAPRRYEFDPADLLQIPIEHPDYPGIDALKLQWCAIPVIANFRMAIGGVQYGCVPFNGWFMETEIARNLWEEDRYGQAEPIAKAMGLDTASEQSLWRDRTFLELNAAVLHSYSKARVTLVDHQTAARQFLAHDLREKRAGRECPAQWSWVTPAAGGSTTPVWHHEMRDFFLNPSYHYTADKWAVLGDELTISGEDGDADAGVTDRPLILFGSETGTAESYARQMARRLGRHHPRVMALDEIEPAALAHERLVLVVASTFGNGEAPGNATGFLKAIRQLPMGSVGRFSFAVMGLGSTVYPNFCATGIALDRELARIGGNRAVSLHLGDELKGQADTYRHWLELVARLLGEDPTSAGRQTDTEERTAVTLLTEGAAALIQAEHPRVMPGTEVRVVENRELLKQVIAGSRSTRFLSFDIADTDLSYETGDHIAIYPRNPADLVARLCRRLNADPTQWFITQLVDSNGQAIPGTTAYPSPVRIGDVLTDEVDLSLREPITELLTLLLQRLPPDADRAKLEGWLSLLTRDADKPTGQALKVYLIDQYLTVADLLDAFPSAAVSFDQLIQILPRQKPRLYSVSSCSLVHPQQIHITVGVVHAPTSTGLVRPGLCSNFLAGLQPGDRLRLAVRTSNFRPPIDPRVPMLLVGPGTGLAPLVGFLQHREVQLRALLADADLVDMADSDELIGQVGQTRLYFGCHDLNDYLYQEELETWHEAGVLTHLDVAFSRMGEKKIYVQHLIEQQSQELWRVLAQPDCHYYVCGDARMAEEVFAVLMTIARSTGGMTHAQAVAFFERMRRENRFFSDVWGVLVNSQQDLADVQEARYSQGERWLERVNSNSQR